MIRESTTPVLEDDCLYDTVASGTFLGFQSNTLRNSRCTGKLAGVDAPAFVKMGSVVRYRGKTLKEWRAQFSEQTSTSDVA